MIIPGGLNDLSVEFFSSILACPVASFSVDSSEFQGNTSLLYSVTINFASPLTFPPRRLFLKFALPAEDGTKNISFNRQKFISAAVYRKEIAFYKYSQSPECPVHIKNMLPPIYYAEIEQPGGLDHFLLVMGEAGQPLNQLNAYSNDVSREVISKIAQFHANFITKIPESLEICALPSHFLLNQIIFGVDAADQSPQELLKYCEDHFEAKFNDFVLVAAAMCSADEIAGDLIQIKSRFRDKSIFSDLRIAFKHSFLEPAFKTLIHGDFRFDNMLIDPSDDSIKFIDFQALHRGHPAYDLAQFIIQCHVDPLKVFDELVTIYYNTLCEREPHVAQCCTLEGLMISVKSAAIFQVLLLSFHLAPLKSMIDESSGKLPASMDRFMDVIAVITKRGLKTYNSL